MQLGRRVGLLAVGSLICHGAAAMPVLTPFINELHYDNSGPDVGEFIEIAGSAQSLLGFSLLLYNGGNGASYRAITLDTAIPDQLDGFGAVAVFINGLQNGPADGIALVEDFDRVLDWLSYEGQLLGQDGPVMGLLSSALDVLQLPTTAAGLSLQRIGFGSSAADFDWTGPVANSPGAINSGQQFGSTPMGVDEPTGLLLLGLGLLLVKRRLKCHIQTAVS